MARARTCSCEAVAGSPSVPVSVGCSAAGLACMGGGSISRSAAGSRCGGMMLRRWQSGSSEDGCISPMLWSREMAAQPSHRGGEWEAAVSL